MPLTRNLLDPTTSFRRICFTLGSSTWDHFRMNIITSVIAYDGEPMIIRYRLVRWFWTWKKWRFKTHWTDPLIKELLSQKFWQFHKLSKCLKVICISLSTCSMWTQWLKTFYSVRIWNKNGAYCKPLTLMVDSDMHQRTARRRVVCQWLSKKTFHCNACKQFRCGCYNVWQFNYFY